MCSDNKRVIYGVMNKIDTESKCTQEESTIIEVVKRDTSKARIEIDVECSNNKTRKG